MCAIQMGCRLVGIIGASNSADTMLVYPLIITSNFIQAAYSARGSDLDANKLALLMGETADAYKPHFFRTCPSDTRMADATALLIQNLGWNQV